MKKKQNKKLIPNHVLFIASTKHCFVLTPGKEKGVKEKGVGLHFPHRPVSLRVHSTERKWRSQAG